MDDVIQEIARGMVAAELEKLEKLTRESVPKPIAKTCDDLADYLSTTALRQTYDRLDLLELREQVDVISNLVRLFHATSEQRSSWWARPLLRECYEKVGLDADKRTILIIHSERMHSEDPNHFLVYPDLLSNLEGPLQIEARPVIDVFQIPLEARHDLASIALVAHEVGHIFIEDNFHLIEAEISEFDLDDFLGVSQHDELDDLFALEDHKERKDTLAEELASQVEEYLCDAVARHLLGPAFDFALIKYLVPATNFRAITHSSRTHPPNLIRIRDSGASFLRAQRFLQRDGANIHLMHCLGTIARSWRELILDSRIGRVKKLKLEREEILARGFVRRLACNHALVPGEDRGALLTAWNKVEPELAAFRPPFETVDRHNPEPIHPLEALQASIIYYYGARYRDNHQFFAESELAEREKVALIRRVLISHVTYSISLFEFVSRSNEAYCSENFSLDKLQGTLWDSREEVHQSKLRPVVVTPSIHPEKQYGYNAIDLRLGQFFLINQASRYTHIQPKPDLSKGLPPNSDLQSGIRAGALQEFYEEVHKPVGGVFVLHPHQFVLASTLEYVSLPSQYYALVLGRSTWGRLGLNIATATTVQAGFKGCLTLELRNLGETPLPLYVGSRIAQLCLIDVPSTSIAPGYSVKGGKYVGPVKPEIPKIHEDDDWIVLGTHASSGRVD